MNIINESPIQDIHVSDNIYSGHGFDKKDQKLISSPVMHERYKRAFEKTPHVFEIFFDDSEDLPANHGNDAGYWNIKVGAGVRKSFKHIKGSPGIIKVVLVGNLADQNKIPVTPWTLAHKIGHSFEDTAETSDISKKVNNAIKRFFYTISEGDHGYKAEIIYGMTTKAAREGMIERREWETPAELIAQYLIKGKVTLNANVNNVDAEDAKKIQILENTINKFIFKLFKAIEGYVIVEL